MYINRVYYLFKCVYLFFLIKNIILCWFLNKYSYVCIARLIYIWF